MDYGYITFRSVTHAQRGERILESAGITCNLGRTPRWMEQQGCGYSLRLRRRELEQAGWLLKREGISFRKLYEQGSQGIYREVAL